jgi:hypothetical protein
MLAGFLPIRFAESVVVVGFAADADAEATLDDKINSEAVRRFNMIESCWFFFLSSAFLFFVETLLCPTKKIFLHS